MMGFCSDKDSEFTVVDNDNIEISNLTRQFLFRRNNVGQPKSIVASKSVKEMNQSFNVKGIQTKVCIETEKVFDEKFWEKQDIIIYAVDSIEGRKYLDNKVLFFHKPAVDSGTEGVVAKSQVIIPYKTCSYLDKASTQAPKTIPVCTLSNFPSLIQHCIEWSKDSFYGYFGSIINDVRSFFADYEKFKRNIKSEGGFSSQLKKLNIMKLQIDIIINKDVNKMCEYAIKSYTENFDHRIRQLLIAFPPDSKNELGMHFWVGARKLPHPIKFDPNNDLCLNYVTKFVYILSHALGVQLTKEQLSSENIKKICLTITPPEFLEKKMKIDMSQNSINLSEVEAEQNSKEENEAKTKIEDLYKELDKIREKHSQFDYKNINSEKFEKDHEDNGHIDFIHFGANLRAENYGIDKCDRNKTKQIAGKIISTVLTTTASIAGITSLQLYTMLQTNEKKYFRECLIDLGSNNYCLMEPRPPVKKKDKKPNDQNKFPQKFIPEGWNNWDRIEIRGSKTCGELIDYLKKEYNIDVEMLYVGSETPIYNIHSKLKNNVGIKIEEAYENKIKAKIKEDTKYFLLSIFGSVPEAKIEDETFKNVSVNIPPIKYIFK
jgi:ubiquitin-activating enzyme E1